MKTFSEGSVSGRKVNAVGMSVETSTAQEVTLGQEDSTLCKNNQESRNIQSTASLFSLVCIDFYFF